MIVGDRVTIKSGVQLWDGVRIEDGVFIGPNATFTNDLFPRSKDHSKAFLQTVVKAGASIGANVTILPGTTIGNKALVGAGAVVTKNVPPHAVVVGNPAHIINYRASLGNAEQVELKNIEKSFSSGNTNGKVSLGIGGCELWTMPSIDDMRGSLMVAEFSENLPFQPQRCFFVHDVKSHKVRGEHAHRVCEQFLIAIHGELSVVVDNGSQRKEVHLGQPSVGLYMPAGIWGIQYKFSSDGVLVVFASHPYQADDYIRDYSEFLKYVT